MAAKLSSGLEVDDPLADFRFNLDIPSLFKRLCDKPGCVWITTQNREKMLRSLPEDYHPHIPESGAILMSVFAGDTPVAIIHADNRGEPLDEFHNKRIRYVCTAASQALKRLS